MVLYDLDINDLQTLALQGKNQQHGAAKRGGAACRATWRPSFLRFVKEGANIEANCALIESIRS